MHHHSAPTHAVRQPAINPFDLNRRVLASDLSLAAKAVLLAILDHARHGRSVCTAGNRTLAREVGISDRHVKNILPDLAARGLIRIERATGSKHSRHTISIGPYMHEVGNPFPLRLHEVGTEFPPGRKSGVHEVGTQFPVRDSGRDTEKDDLSPLDSEGLTPLARAVFGRFRPPG
jgi:hypothetical protein